MKFSVLFLSTPVCFKREQTHSSLKCVRQNTCTTRQKRDVTILHFQNFSTHIMDIKGQRPFGMSAVHVTVFNQFNWIWKTL